MLRIQYLLEQSKTLLIQQLILQRNQCTDYIDDVLQLVTINKCDDTTTDQILTQTSFPYQIAHVVLPQYNT